MSGTRVNREDLETVWRHIETTNREMGGVQTDIGWIKKELTSIKQWMKWFFGMTVTLFIALLGVIFKP